jgi:hypothetical protein
MYTYQEYGGRGEELWSFDQFYRKLVIFDKS